MANEAKALGRLRHLIICDRPPHAALIRAVPTRNFAIAATAICAAPEVMKVFAAPKWDELGADGQQWIMAVVREAMAVAAERAL